MLADIFVGSLNYLKYVDDIFISDKKKLYVKHLFNKISNLHPSLKCTRENEVDGCLLFLYVSLQRTSTSFIILIYRKLTFVGQYIQWKSFCANSRKVSLVSCLVFWAYKICLKVKINEEIQNIRSIFRLLGYPTDIIKRTIERTIVKLTSLTKQGPKKCLMY